MADRISFSVRLRENAGLQRKHENKINTYAILVSYASNINNHKSCLIVFPNSIKQNSRENYQSVSNTATSHSSKRVDCSIKNGQVRMPLWNWSLLDNPTFTACSQTLRQFYCMFVYCIEYIL